MTRAVSSSGVGTSPSLFRTPLMRPTPRFAHSGDCGAFVPPLLYSPEAYFLRAIPLGW
jgi:hypothetical protein